MGLPADTLLRLEGVSRTFGQVKALSGVDLTIRPGEVLGLVGHNGAGKSTLMNILSGVFPPSAGQLSVGPEAARIASIADARRLGIRCIFQELSLCPNLTVAENARVDHAGLTGFGWRRRAGALILSRLDEIFPGHGIRADDAVEDLSITRRQMVEVARAFAGPAEAIGLVILDEPTSSLDFHAARQLLTYVRRIRDRGVSTIIISHMLGEILSTADRIVVMRDGTIVADRPAADFDRDGLIAAMGNTHKASEAVQARAGLRTGAPLVDLAPMDAGGLRLTAHRGEIVGLAGLAGQGQTEALLAIFRAASGKRVAMIAGDRQLDGIFPLASIADNVTIRSLKALRDGPLISPARERAMAEDWAKKVGIRTPDMRNNILTLSGGNQQKALFARALASDADIILMDDPMRGVDIGTKMDVYDLIRREAAGGRTFIWYTTEFDELGNCDHVYVFRSGAVVAELAAGAVTEDSIIHSSFTEAVSA